MADRFPLIVNEVSRKIEEIVAGDKLELTGNGIIISGDAGAGKYLKSDGSTVFWEAPGDVYLDQSQTVTNKTFESCVINGNVNTIANIPNTALVNSGITINGATIALGGVITTPNDDTKFSISAIDGIDATEKNIRLTGTDGTTTSDVILKQGTNVTLTRNQNEIVITSSYVDTDTITSIQAASGGAAQTGIISIAGTGSTTVSQDISTKTITINSSYVDTVTRLRSGTGNVFNSGDFTFLQGGATTLAQSVDGNGDPTITISSSDTVTRIKGGGTGTLTSGDITISGGTNTTVSQAGSTVTIDSTDTNTVTKVAANSEPLGSGDFRIIPAGATSISTAVNNGVKEITISSVNTDSGAAATASLGVQKVGNDFRLKNGGNLTGNTLVKWDSGNNQLANSLISDNGSAVTVGGDLVVTGTQTILETATLIVEDNQIELRKGNSLTGADGGVQVNRTTDAQGSVITYQALQWYESGGYWRAWDGSVEKRFVTENDTQTLTNKTLSSPILSAPTLGAATATSINGLEITSTASATLDLAANKTLDVNRDLVLTSDDNANAVNINFRNGGDVAFKSDTLASFSSTTSTQLRGLISDTTGTSKLVFQTSPFIETSIQTGSSTFGLLNATATTINFAGAATAINIGSSTGTTTIAHDTVLSKDLTVGTTSSDTILLNGTVNIENADLSIRGLATDPIRVGRGNGAVASNTGVGTRVLNSASSAAFNTAFGFESLFTANSGSSNTAVGYYALRSTGTGDDNTAVGSNSMLGNLGGEKNTALGCQSLASATESDANIAIGHYAGYGQIAGTGNVIIGPADDENSTNVTYVLPSSGGSRQLIIGSGTVAWIRGDSTGKVTIENNAEVGGDLLLKGSLTVDGTTTTVNTNILSVDDKEINLGDVIAQTFTAACTNGSNTISNVFPTSELIPGLEVVSSTAGISVPIGTVISTITGNVITLSNSVTGAGNATFTTQGADDSSANGGGIRLKGDTDKRIFYDNSRTDKYWVMTENLELGFNKKFVINNQLVLDTTTLGGTVLNSSLTSVGTLNGLAVDGAISLGGVVTEKVFNSYSTSLGASAGTLTVNIAGANTLLGTPTSNAITTWAFTGVGLSNGQSKTLTLVLDANTAATYGDACTVDGVAISTGVQWSGGSPPVATSNTDILTFVLIRDNSGVTKVFGQGNTDFS